MTLNTESTFLVNTCLLLSSHLPAPVQMPHHPRHTNTQSFPDVEEDPYCFRTSVIGLLSTSLLALRSWCNILILFFSLRSLIWFKVLPGNGFPVNFKESLEKNILSKAVAPILLQNGIYTFHLHVIFTLALICDSLHQTCELLYFRVWFIFVSWWHTCLAHSKYLGHVWWTNEWCHQ